MTRDEETARHAEQAKQPRNADAALPDAESHPLRRRYPPVVHWKQEDLSSSYSMGEETMVNALKDTTKPAPPSRKKKRKRHQSHEESVRAKNRSHATSSSTHRNNLNRFFATAPAKSKRQMHLSILQSACRKEADAPFQGIDGSHFKGTVADVFNDFSRLVPCQECHQRRRTTHKCRVSMQHKSDLDGSLAAVMWARMQHHWAQAHCNDGKGVWICQHCNIDILTSESQCFVCQRWQTGAWPKQQQQQATVSRRPTLAFVGRTHREEECSVHDMAAAHSLLYFATQGSPDDSDSHPVSCSAGTSAVQSLLSCASQGSPDDIDSSCSASTTNFKASQDTKSTGAPKLFEDTANAPFRQTSASPEGSEPASIDDASIAELAEAQGSTRKLESGDGNLNRPARVTELSTIMDPSVDLSIRRPMLSRILLAAHQYKKTPNAPFQGSDGRHYWDIEAAFDLFSGMLPCDDCRAKKGKPFECRVKQHHTKDLDREAFATKLFRFSSRKKNWIDASDSSQWICPRCMICMPGSRSRCGICMMWKGGKRPPMAKKQKTNASVGGPSAHSLQDLHRLMDPSSNCPVQKQILGHIVEVASHNREAPEAPYLDVTIQLAFDLFSGIATCGSCIANGCRSPFECRITKEHTTDLDDSTECIILNRARLATHGARRETAQMETHDAIETAKPELPAKEHLRQRFEYREDVRSIDNATFTQKRIIDAPQALAELALPICFKSNQSSPPSITPSDTNDSVESKGELNTRGINENNPALPTVRGKEAPTEARSKSISPTSILLETASTPAQATLQLPQALKSDEPTYPRHVHVWECYLCHHRNHSNRGSCAHCSVRLGGMHMSVPEESTWSI